MKKHRAKGIGHRKRAESGNAGMLASGSERMRKKLEKRQRAGRGENDQ
ncbi:MAG: hypothetical protein K9K79_13705 [Desulfohalobiaceae bacterium]|nr:hypothetical protein [Desulfohalobiaceae bacterium]